MRTLARIEIGLDEKVLTESGRYETQMITHNFSIRQTVQIMNDMIYSLHQILTPEEMKDLRGELDHAWDERRSVQGIDSFPARLKIHEF
jgi:hypothetical protein